MPTATWVNVELRLGLIGLGNVGTGFLELLNEKQGLIRERYGLQLMVVGIADLAKGSIYDENGLDLAKLVELSKREGSLLSYPGAVEFEQFTSLDLARAEGVDIIVEATPTNLETGEPGYTHIRTALEAGKHVVTTNKGPIALKYRELKELAAKKGVFLRFEGTVMSGSPCISLGAECLRGAEVTRMRGIVNGTTNYILTEMAKGVDYRKALRRAQELGYTEPDPTADVEGWDAVAKAMILANVFMGTQLRVADVERQGISALTLEDVKAGALVGAKIKLVVRVEKEGGCVRASVRPERVLLTDPLAYVDGVLNALIFTTDTLGDLMLVGVGAGPKPTGQAFLSDIPWIHTHLSGEPGKAPTFFP